MHVSASFADYLDLQIFFDKTSVARFSSVIYKATHLIHLWSWLPMDQREHKVSGGNYLEMVTHVFSRVV